MVFITETRIRLVGGTSFANGQLEILYNGQWGTMCYDTFEKSEANVVCRMLGFEEKYASFVYEWIIPRDKYWCVL